MTTSFHNYVPYSRFNLSESASDILFLVQEYRERVVTQMIEQTGNNPFLSFAEKKLSLHDVAWLQDNTERFFDYTANTNLVKQDYLSEFGFITCMAYSKNGEQIIVGHSSGLVQMRHGSTGSVMCTLRTIQFPPKPIYALEYSRVEENICYASCMDGTIYRIEIPQLAASVADPPQYCIRVDPALECLNTQFYGAPGISSYATPFITQRSPSLSFGQSADHRKMVVGHADSSIKVYDLETQELDLTYKVHKLRLQFIPKKLQRMHVGQVCALRAHPVYPNMFASGAWDKTLRIWDLRCKVGCVMTFEDVDICSDSIDLIRNECVSGSWRTTEALSVWDLVAKKRVSVIRVQNRRPDVDGEYIYACRYWHSTNYNRKGKYAIVGGSGTKCVEVINLHNRYITCSYPVAGTVLAVASHQEKIAFGGTATTFNIVKFHDPKHEKNKYRKADDEPDFDYTRPPLSDDISSEQLDASSFQLTNVDASKKSVTAAPQSKMSKSQTTPLA